MPQGGDELRRLARDLKAAGSDLRRELPKALRRAAKPIVAGIREEAVASLPKRGGLGGYVAKASITTSIRTGANPAVRIVGKKKAGERQVDLPAINRGRLRHPTYGHRPWVLQQVEPGFWDRAVAAHAPAVAQEMQQVLEDIRRRFEAGI